MKKTIKNKKNKIKKNQLNNDFTLLIMPSLVCIFLLIGVVLAVYEKNTQEQPYKYYATNYHEKINVSSSRDLIITDAEFVPKSKNITFKFKITQNVGDVGVGEIIYVKVLDSDKKVIAEQDITNSQDLKFKATKSMQEKFDSNTDKEFTPDLTLDFYAIEDTRELSYKKHISEATFNFEDLYIYDSLSDYFEKNKSEEEQSKELNYIKRKYLTENEIQSLPGEMPKELAKIISKPTPQAHEELGEYYKNKKDMYNDYISILKEKGITQKQIDSVIKSDDTLENKVTSMKELEAEGDDNLDKLVAGYGKELNTSFNYSPEQITELTKGKTLLDQKRTLEKEVNKNKESQSDELDKTVQECKDKKISQKDIDKVLKAKDKTDKDKTNDLKKLIKDKEKK